MEPRSKETMESPTHVEALFEVKTMGNRVHFSKVTTYLFNVAYGGSALPKETGPPIGMAINHFDMYEENIIEMPMTARKRSMRKLDHLERIDMLKKAEYHVKEIAEFCMEAIEIRKSRQDTLDQVRQEKKRKRRIEQGGRTARPRMFIPDAYSDDDEDSSDEEEA